MAGSVRGDKKVFISHLIGKANACKHASAEAIEAAKMEQSSRGSGASQPLTQAITVSKHSRSSTASGPESEPLRKKLKQTDLTAHVFRGIDIPFSPGEKAAIEAQALRATISANWAFQTWDDPEVKKLFWLLRTAAPSAMPSAKMVSMRLLDEAAENVKSKMVQRLKGRLVGLKCILEFIDCCLDVNHQL